VAQDAHGGLGAALLQIDAAPLPPTAAVAVSVISASNRFLSPEPQQ
jgi:hypothetical protein